MTAYYSTDFEGQKTNQQGSWYLYFSVATRIMFLHMHTLFASDPDLKLAQTTSWCTGIFITRPVSTDTALLAASVFGL